MRAVSRPPATPISTPRDPDATTPRGYASGAPEPRLRANSASAIADGPGRLGRADERAPCAHRCAHAWRRTGGGGPVRTTPRLARQGRPRMGVERSARQRLGATVLFGGVG